MSLITSILEAIQGKIHFYLSVGGTPAVEIIIRDKVIIAEIKNPLLALELGIQQFAQKKDRDSYVLSMIKQAGYKVKVKYKMFELEL